MDATRPRRLRDTARQRWYARWRCERFARHLGFARPARPEVLSLWGDHGLHGLARPGAAVRLCG